MGKENKQEEEEQRGRKSLEARDGKEEAEKLKGLKQSGRYCPASAMAELRW